MAEPQEQPAVAEAAPALRLPLWRWLIEGLRASVFLTPRVAGRQPAPAQLILLFAGLALLDLALSRLEVWGDAEFNLRGWLVPWWGTGVAALLAWWALPAGTPAQRPAGLPAWLALWAVALVPVGLLSQGLNALLANGQLADWLPPWSAESATLSLLLEAWAIAVALRLAHGFGSHAARQGVLAVGLALVVGLQAWQLPDRPWLPVATEDAAAPPRLELTQETFEAQQAAWDRAVRQLAPPRPGTTNVYGLVFSPYGDEDVFLREADLVADLLGERFDAGQRVLRLVNHPTTAAIHPWATPLNLQRAIDALAARMDRERDLLVVYLTSHGAADHRLEASLPPLGVDSLSPGELRIALDRAGIRHRVIAVSACFSGGWVAPLADDHTLVMTAADASHTSYGCGSLSQLTFFGRAVFDEQLRKTRSFEQAFAAAVPVIKVRELQAGKDDGFSNPQISVGEQIRPLLRELEHRLDKGTP